MADSIDIYDNDAYCAYVCEDLLGCEDACHASYDPECGNDDDEDCSTLAIYSFIYGIDEQAVYDIEEEAIRLFDEDRKGPWDAGSYTPYRLRGHAKWLRENWTGGRISEQPIVIQITWTIKKSRRLIGSWR